MIDLFEGFNGLMAVGFGITPAAGQNFQQAVAGRFGSVFGEPKHCALGNAVLRVFSAVHVATAIGLLPSSQSGTPLLLRLASICLTSNCLQAANSRHATCSQQSAQHEKCSSEAGGAGPRQFCCWAACLIALAASQWKTACADPFLNDQNFVLSVLTLEELGATGNKVGSHPGENLTAFDCLPIRVPST